MRRLVRIAPAPARFITSEARLQVAEPVGERRDHLLRSHRADGRSTVEPFHDRIVAAGNYAEVHAGGKPHLLRETMASLEARLDPQRFVRISRAAIVATLSSGSMADKALTA